MRHLVKGKKLNRDTHHRQALFRNLIGSLIEHGSIETTEAKAKAIKGQVDKLITKAKTGTIHNRRQIAKNLPKRKLVNRLVDEIAPQTGKRTSGFTRIIRLGQQRGDASLKVRLEFVDTLKAKEEVKEVKSTKTPQKQASAPKPEKKTAKKETKKPAKSVAKEGK